MQGPRAAGAGLALDVDHHLEAGKVRRQGAPVGPAWRRSRSLHGGTGRLSFGDLRRLDLLHVFQPKLELVDGQGLGAAAEAMSLQLLDDLGQAIGPGALGQEHRLQRGHVVRKRFSQGRHDPD